MITPGQHIFNTCNEGCPHAGNSGENKHGALERDGFALFSNTVYEDLINMSV